MDSQNYLQKLGPVTHIVDIGNGQTMKHYICQLHQNVDSSPMSQPTNNYYFPFKPDTPALETNLVSPLPRDVNKEPEEPHYPQLQHRPPDIFIHERF